MEKHTASTVDEQDEVALFASLRELAATLNQSPAAVKALARYHLTEEYLRPTDVLDRATVREVGLSALTVELRVVDMLDCLGETGGHLPRRTFIASIPLSRTCESAAAAEDALVGMIAAALDVDDHGEDPEIWI
jgi:hypothetical protein